MPEAILRYLRYTSWPIIAAMVALVVFGVLAIRVSEQADSTLAGQSAKQAKFAIVALCAFLAATLVPYPKIGKSAYWLFGGTLALLVLVFFLPAIKGSRRWIPLGPVNFQPSELAKLTYIILLAWYLRYGDHYRRLRGLAIPFALAFVPMGLILYEPDLGTTLLFLPTLYFMLFMAGAKVRHLVLIVAVGAIVMLFPVPRRVNPTTFGAQAAKFKARTLGSIKFLSVREDISPLKRPEIPIAYCRVQVANGNVYDIQPLSLRVMRGHQNDRIEGWLRQDDPAYPRIAQDEGFQLRWSLVTLSTGGWIGRVRSDGDGLADRDPYGEMLNVALNKLPEDHTDFIFSVVAGRWGFVGCAVLLGLYCVILVFGTEIASLTYDPFGRLLAIGVLGLLLSQLFINIAMTMGLMPITGMTLPLVSYGGTSLVINCAALGLLVNVGQHRPILLSRHPFEYGRKREKRTNIESTVDLSARSEQKR